MSYPGYPLPTEKLGDLAAEIQALAEWADARLPGLGTEVITGHYTTNGTGDLVQKFATITNVQCVLQAAFLNVPGAPSWVTLTVPVFAILSGSPADTIWAHCVNQAGVAHANVAVQCCFYAWGTPK